MFKYLVEPNGGDSHQVSSWWLAMVIPFAVRDTVDRQLYIQLGLRNVQSVSSDTVTRHPVEEGETMLLSEEIQSYSCSSRKGSAQGTCSISLQPHEDWRSKIAAGDWLILWAFDNEYDYRRIKKSLESKPRGLCNDFMSGLKFVGKVQGVKRRKSVGSATGTPIVSYNLTAVSFKELSYSIYYHPSMRSKYKDDDVRWMTDFAGEANNFFLGQKAGTRGVAAGKAISDLLRICLGIGPGEKWTKGIASGTLSPDEDTALLPASPNGAVLVPPTITELLVGDTPVHVNSGKGIFADVLVPYIGIQTYTNSRTVTRKQVGRVDPNLVSFAVAGFTPDLNDNFLAGEFLPRPPDWNQQPIWSIVSTYLNDPINEMYATLRATPSGRIMPSIIARQTPFSSQALASSLKASQVTRFIDLPRWVIHPHMVKEEDIGQSDALKINYVFCPSLDISVSGSSATMNIEANYIANPPMVDLADIQRSGLQMYTRTIGATINEFQTTADNQIGRFWTRLMGDFLFGQHLRFTGTLTTTFIHEPICIGDNCQYDGGIYHIEGVTHQGQISHDGRKEMATTLQLTNGISVDTDDVDDNIYMVDEPYSGRRHTQAVDKSPRNTRTDEFRVFDAHTIEKRGKSGGH